MRSHSARNALINSFSGLISQVSAAAGSQETPFCSISRQDNRVPFFMTFVPIMAVSVAKA
jgi:hypothetical protein